MTIVTRLARASSIARRLSTWASASAWSRPFSTMPARSAASVSRNRTSLRRKTRRRTVWTLSTPTTASFQISGTEHIEVSRGSSRPWSQANRRSRRTLRLTCGRRVWAARPVSPTPIGRRATPIWSRSSPLVAARVTPEPSRSTR